VKRPAQRLSPPLAVAFLTALLVAALALVAAPPAATASGPVALYAGGHPFGIGEQQVYLIDRASTLTVRYRDNEGELRTKTFHYHAQTSVAWTIEGISSAGGPVLAVTTAAPTAPDSASPMPPPSAEPIPHSPEPSPMLDAHGVGAPARGSALDELTPASLLLAGIKDQLPDVGKPWRSSGVIPLPFGTLTLTMDHVIETPKGDQDANLAVIQSTGTSGFSARVRISSFGVAALHGGGTVSALSYLETMTRLLLGTTISATSHGNVSASSIHGAYELQSTVAIKLAKYVPGLVPNSGSPGFVPASDYLGSTTAPDSQIYSTARPDTIAVPAATDTGFIPPPAVATPYHSALPAASLPPIPLPMPSGQAAASPPAGPTPTPQPTHY
jgi:hypothetical protein